MPLRDAPLPRMAGHLPFMRGPVVTLDRLRPGQIAAFGVALGGALDGASLGPLGLRETSSYFGSHFASNMKSAMDVDQRRVLDASSVAGRLVDLGDLDFAAGASPGDDIAALSAGIARLGAIPVMLGGSRRWTDPMRLGLSDALAAHVAAVGLHESEVPTSGAPMLVVLDLADIASTWHGASLVSRFDGLAMREVRRRLRDIGRRTVAGVAVVGLDPARQGLSTVKTGQRFLITALLDLVYARLAALQLSECTRG